MLDDGVDNVLEGKEAHGCSPEISGGGGLFILSTAHTLLRKRCIQSKNRELKENQQVVISAKPKRKKHHFLKKNSHFHSFRKRVDPSPQKHTHKKLCWDTHQPKPESIRNADTQPLRNIFIYLDLHILPSRRLGSSGQESRLPAA